MINVSLAVQDPFGLHICAAFQCSEAILLIGLIHICVLEQYSANTRDGLSTLSHAINIHSISFGNLHVCTGNQVAYLHGSIPNIWQHLGRKVMTKFSASVHLWKVRQTLRCLYLIGVITYFSNGYAAG